LGPKFIGIFLFSLIFISPEDCSNLNIFSFKAKFNLFACSGVKITLDLTFALGAPGVIITKSKINSLEE
jgi:hypothetical protein